MKFSAPHRGWTSGRATPSLRPNPNAAETANPAGRHLSFAEICPDNRSQLCSPRVTDNQRAIGGLTKGTNLRGATAPVTDNQAAIGGLTEGTNLRGATVSVTDNQTAIGGLTEGTNLGVGGEGQANRSHEC